QEDSYFRFYVKGASEMLLQKSQCIIDTKTLAIAYRDLEQWPPDEIDLDPDGEVKFKDLMEDITLLCIVTGDDIWIAKSIAEQCGIYTAEVLAKSSPEDKKILAGILKDEFDDIVAVTGDGSNDGPALRTAD
ncbi:17110_t:CDS:2, partial [Racocetra fulgida]